MSIPGFCPTVSALTRILPSKLIGSCLLLGFCLASAPALVAQSLPDKIDSLVQPYIDSETLDGLCLGVLHQGKSSVSGYGKLGAPATERPNGDTVYEIGSITKVFTGLLLADAVNRGAVRLDQPMLELFPTEIAKPHESLVPISLVQLSTHTSGLPRLPGNIDLSDIDDPYSKYTPELLFQFLSQHKLRRPVGSKHEYSNLGTGLLGWLIARQNEKSYETLLKQRILDPLGLSDTAITLSDSQKQRMAPGYDENGMLRSPWEFSALVAAGGLRSTVHDMLKFAAAHLKPPAGEVGEAIELAWKIHQSSQSPPANAMGLGWIVDRDGETRFHNGGTGGYHSMLFVSRKHDLAVIALSNTASFQVDRLARDVFNLLAGEKVEPRKFEPNLKIADEVMQRYVGVYQLVPNVEFTVSVQDGKLLIGLTGQRTMRVFPKSETEWAYKSVKATVTFRQDTEGNWNELVLLQNGIRQKAVRVNR